MKHAFGVKHNLIANLVGKAWTGILSLVMVPIYVKLIGIEAYGLIGVYVTLTALIGFLDLGLTTTMNREMARRAAVDSHVQETRDLIRTLEIVYWSIGIVVGLGIAAAAPIIAHHWVHPQGVSPQIVQQAIMIMGVLFAFQWPDSFYAGGLMGLQKQVLLNGIRIVMGTVQALGSLLVLLLWSRTILAYFLWQTVAYTAQTLLLVYFLWGSLPKTGRRSQFRSTLWTQNARFTAGVTGITITSIILSQSDKVLLSNLLSLKMFGYYMLATTLATNLLYYPVMPLQSAVFPRMTQLVAQDRSVELAQFYHKGCQLLSVIVIPIALTVALFSRQLLSLYLRDAQTVNHTYMLLSLLVVGTAFNSIMVLPFSLQLAYGYTKLPFYVNLVALLIFIPALRWMTLHYGVVGAAWLWIVINGAYLVFEIPLMHRRLFPAEMWRWYLVDVGLPFAVAFCVVWLARLFIRDTIPLPAATLSIGIACLLACGATALSLQFTRQKIADRPA